MQATKNAGIASSGMGRNARVAQFESIQKFSFEDLDYFGVPSLLTRLSFLLIRIAAPSLVAALININSFFIHQKKLENLKKKV